MKNKLVAVIPVRSGSQRVKNKNFKKFGNKNLLINKIEKLKKLKDLDQIIINTDSLKAIKIAELMGVNYFKRESYYASSKCSNSEFWSYIGKVTNSEYIMFTNCTSPMVKISTYKKFIKYFMKNKKKYNSFNTVSDIKEYLLKNNKPINFNFNSTPNSQDLPKIFKLNFAINIIKTKDLFKNKSVMGSSPFLYKLNEIEGFDIDTPLDFEYANYLYKKKTNK